MKTIKTLFILTLFSMAIYSCSSDSDNNNTAGNDDLANMQNETENAAIEVDNLNTGIDIEGATKNDGAPPAPNSNIDLQVDSNNAEAYQNSGFNLKFSTTETTIAGAYLQFQDVNNNSASNYFDIPSSSFLTGKSSNTKGKTASKRLAFSRGNNNMMEEEFEIDIDFEDSFPAGQFCGTLCIYDSANNISQAVTVCVEVEAWGGNSSIVGTWVEVSSTDIDNGTQIFCSNGQTKNVPYVEYLKQEFTFTIESDGDFRLIDDEEYKTIDYSTSTDNCEAVYFSEIEKYNAEETGKWAYNEVDNTLTLVSFKYVDFLEPQYSEDYPNGDLILEAGEVEIINGNLVVTETYVDGNETYTDTYTFKRI
ncbi:hypothetical protein GCM10023311_21950 [Flaviramulus aquimarinus]|uniref:Lipocalin-like domain-containing protein n=1 Tax=Flaviramulus aquimarinus TaxID=1170456 RepID=A0ABP9FCC1_9FLAO